MSNSPDSQSSAYHNMRGWSEAIGRAAHLSDSPELGKLAKELSKTKADYAQEFEALHLPTFTRYIEPLGKFLTREIVRDEGMNTPTL